MSQKKMPKDVKVGPYRYSIKNDKSSMDSARVRFETIEAIGFTSTHEQCIFVDPELSEDMRAETLLHEIMHVVCEATGISTSFDEKEEESFIATVSPLLLDTLRENREVAEYLLDWEEE
jgi:Zn-dependent peptidase ImmA (M78 family)